MTSGRGPPFKIPSARRRRLALTNPKSRRLLKTAPTAGNPAPTRRVKVELLPIFPRLVLVSAKIRPKIYDKLGLLLRIKTTTSDVSAFKHYRLVERHGARQPALPRLRGPELRISGDRMCDYPHGCHILSGHRLNRTTQFAPHRPVAQ
jgi:hypothetical protein